MLTDTIFQPDNLSTAEWELLQLLATCADSFSVEDVLAEQHNETLNEREALTFYRHFYRLKNCSYIEAVPSGTDESANHTSVYKLSAMGIKVLTPKEKPVYPMRSLASRKARHPGSSYLKK